MSPTQSPPRLHATQNDLAPEVREPLVELLNRRLADALDLQSQAKQAHWNVKGPGFIALHELFDQVYQAAAEAVDLLAERAVQLGGIAEGTVRIAASRSELVEYPTDIADGSEHVKALSTALAAFGSRIRAAIGEAERLSDAGTADLLTEISRSTDKLLWMVEAHAQAAH